MDKDNSLFEGTMKFFRDLKDKFLNSKNSKKYVLIGSLLGALLIVYGVYNKNTKAYAIYLDEDVVGVVKTEEECSKIISEVKDDIEKENNVKVILEDNIETKKTHVKKSEIPSEKEVVKNLKSKVDYKVTGYNLSIDGEKVGTLKTIDEIRDIVEEVKAPYEDIKENSKLKEIEILEKLEVDKIETSIDKIDEAEKVLEFIKTGAEDTKTHIVEVGESFWTIAKIYDMTVEDLESANEGVVSEKLKPGDEVKLIKPASKVTVVTSEEVEYIDNIDFETKVEEDSSMYNDEKKVKVEGSRGEKKRLVSEKKHNGVKVEEEVIKEEIVKEPVDQVVVKGTKEKPSYIATGVFSMPTRGRVSSGFGRRWGRMHRGLDIAAGSGTPIKAADGGTVTFSGRNGSYGNLVEIDHGNGYKTRYAHCSKIHVRNGQKVAKGEHIANVGNTGRSTGPHLHLEVIKNGVHQNPSNYVR